MGPSLRELREVAERCARIGGAVLRGARGAGPGEVREKGRHDFVTEVDAASEAAIAAALRERFPGHFLLAEEAAAGAGSWRAQPLSEPAPVPGLAGAGAADFRSAADADRASDGRHTGSDRIEWIVDPLDGTTNFIHGFPVFAVSIAARGPDGLLVGVVYDPTRDELFSAARGEGARLNGEAIRVSTVADPGRALVGTGFPFRNARFTEPYLESFERVFAAVSDIRRAGSASVDLAYVACGRLDGFWELGLSPWDTAAGWLLIEEAGGVVTDDRGGSDVFGRGHVVAGGPAVHRTLLEIARTSFGEKVEPPSVAADVTGASDASRVEAIARLPPPARHRATGGAAVTGPKLRVAVVFGGRSGEHEVSLMSARSVVAALDPGKYEVMGIGITREGRWLLTGDPLSRLLQEAGASFEERPSTRAIALAPDPSSSTLVPLDGAAGREALAAGSNRRPDVIIPLVHGTHGEDGTLQGLLELAEIPYVGSGVLGSAVGMDKAVFKAVMQAGGVPVAPFRLVHAPHAGVNTDDLLELGRELGYPLFVKPANGGSSLGVTKVKREKELAAAVREAAQYDPRVLLERAVAGRELECAVLGNDEPEASVVGEVIPGHEFYDYDDKYFDDKARTVIPADVPAAKAEEVRALAVRAFRAIDAAGMARVDFFLEEGSGNVYVNEINTIPGFTRISMYPKLWDATGLPFPRLLDRLILLALERAEGMRARKLSP